MKTPTPSEPRNLFNGDFEVDDPDPESSPRIAAPEAPRESDPYELREWNDVKQEC